MHRIKRHNFNFDGEKLPIIIENYPSIKEIGIERKKILNNEIHELLANCWGSFPPDFVTKHILGAHKMLVARLNGKCIGLCVLSIKNILNIKVHYMEFLLIDKKYQKCGLGSFLSSLSIKQEIVKNLGSLIIGKPLEIIFITPNIRVLAHTAKLASFIYPNPYSSDEKGEIGQADEETWQIAKELLRNSDNPSRKLERDGLVLIGSYANTPWLIYNNDNAPWHSNDKINAFAKRYLGYHTGEDREFIVRAHINLFSIFRHLLQI